MMGNTISPHKKNKLLMCPRLLHTPCQFAFDNSARVHSPGINLQIEELPARNKRCERMARA